MIKMILLTTLVTINLLASSQIDSAMDLYKKGNFKQSQITFSTIKGNEARYNEANCFYNLKNYDKSIKIYDNLTNSLNRLENKAFLFRVYFNLGNSYMQKYFLLMKEKNIEEAVDTIYLAKDSYKEAKLLNSSDADLKINLRILEDEISIRDIK